MHHLTKITLLAAVIAGISVSIAATATDSADSPLPSLTGKAVIVEREGWHIGVRENVRFVTIGENSFVVIPRPKNQSEQYEYWMPLEQVSGIKVFDKTEDAVAHDQLTSPLAQRNGDPPKDPATMEHPATN